MESRVEVGRREDICLIGRGISKGKGLEVKGSYVYLRNWEKGSMIGIGNVENSVKTGYKR